MYYIADESRSHGCFCKGKLLTLEIVVQGTDITVAKDNITVTLVLQLCMNPSMQSVASATFDIAFWCQHIDLGTVLFSITWVHLVIRTWLQVSRGGGPQGSKVSLFLALCS